MEFLAAGEFSHFVSLVHLPYGEFDGIVIEGLQLVLNQKRIPSRSLQAFLWRIDSIVD